jgi:hypothetical protein
MVIHDDCMFFPPWIGKPHVDYQPLGINNSPEELEACIINWDNNPVGL